MRNKPGRRPDDPWMMYPVIHRTICAGSQRERTLVVIGTKEQIDLLNMMVSSLERGTLLQDVARLIPHDRNPGNDTAAAGK